MTETDEDAPHILVVDDDARLRQLLHRYLLQNGYFATTAADAAEAKARAKSIAFDLIVLDSAPILPVTDAVELAALADATVLVASADRTTATMLATAVERLNQVDAPLVGVVLNRAPERGLRSYGYGYGYGYGSSGGAPDDSPKE